MKLIGALTSPYVRKVRIVMAEKKLDYQLELEDVWTSDAILKSNPLGKVPCLVMEGGEAVFDSRVIVEYVDTLSPVGRLIPERGRERAEVRTWEALADGVLDAAVAARLEQTWAGRTEAQRSGAWVDRQMSRITTALLTNSFKEFRAHIESHVDFTIFDLVIDSSEVGHRKPEPEIYELTTQRLGIAPERILYLDDFLANVTGARDAGWDAIHVTGPQQALAALAEALGSPP